MKKPSAPIIFVAVLASLLEIIDTSIVNVALPSMMGNLGATLEDISMVITGYAIANAVVLPASGFFSERFGRRKYYLGCIIAFILTSVACGFAPNLLCLTIFRIFQGLAGGALLPTSQALIYEQFPKEKAGIAGAIFGMSVMIGPTLGPVLGGYLTDHLGWRSIFNVNLPLGLIALAIGSQVIFDREKSKDEKEAKPGFDGWGLALLVAGIGCLQFVLERGESDDWYSSKLISFCTAVAAMALPAFIWWEMRVKNPIINIRLFKERIVTNGVILMSFLGFYLYALVFILPVFVNNVFHYDATQTGSLFIPGSILTAAMMPFIGKEMQKGTDSRLLIFIGFVMLEVCLFALTRFSPLTSRQEVLNMLFIRGFALAFLFVPINSSILSQFGGAELGQVSGMLNLFRQIGGSIGIALVATLLTKAGKQNFLDLTSHVNPFRPAVQEFVMKTQGGFTVKMNDAIGLGDAGSATSKVIAGKIEGQAFVLSFLQLVYMMMFIMLIPFIPLATMKFKKTVTVVSDSH